MSKLQILMMASLSLSLSGSIVFFAYQVGSPSVWNNDEFASLGTFLGGTFGPVAISFAALQYFQNAEQQRKLIQENKTDRLRTDLKHAIQAQYDKIENLLSRQFTVDNRGESELLSLEQVFCSYRSQLIDISVFDLNELRTSSKDQADDEVDDSVVDVFETLAHVTLHVNLLRDLVLHHDKISGGTVEGARAWQHFFRLIMTLKKLNFDIKDWSTNEK